MAQCMIFEEDEVSMENEKGLKYGLVLESSEYVSSDEEDEENTYWDRVKKGSLRVVWHPDGEEEVVLEKNVKLADRSLMPGDVVRRLIEGQDSQRGYVTNTNVICNLQILGKSKVICDIDSKELQFLEFWDTEPGDVYLDSWVGKIEKVTQSITLKFPDGARFFVEEDDFFGELSTFDDIHEKRERDSEFAASCFYPGQRLKGYLSDLQTVKWLNTTKHHCAEAAKKSMDKEVIVTVEKVEAIEMEVHWLCQGFGKVENPDVKMGPPSRTLDAEEVARLKKLDCFEPCSVQIGDKAFYTLKGTDIVQNFPQKGNKTLMHHLLRNKFLRMNSNTVESMNAKNDACDQIMKSDVSDGACKGENRDITDIVSASQDKPSATIESKTVNENAEIHIPSKEIQEDDDDEYISDAESSCSGVSSHSASSNPATKKKKSQHKKGGAIPTKILKKKKLKKSKKREEIALWEFKPGDKIACEVLSTMSYVEVVWQDGTVEKDIPSTELHPIHHLDELEFFPGDFVVPTNEGESNMEYGVVSSVDHAGRTCEVKWIKANQFGSSNVPVESMNSEEVSVYDIKDHLDYKFRPGHVVVRVGGYENQPAGVASGQIYTLGTDGRLLVQWADETKSYCYPQELYLIGDDLSELNSDLDSDEDSDSSHNSSDESWETEDETDVMSGEELEEEQVEKAEAVPVKLDESAEKLFDVAIASLQYLEEFFSLPVVEFCQIECFKEVLKLYKTCKDVDKKLHTSHFDEPKLKKVISSIKSEMKRERQAHFAKKIQELIARNQTHQVENSRLRIEHKSETCSPERKVDMTINKQNGENKSETGGKDDTSQMVVECKEGETLKEQAVGDSKEGGNTIIKEQVKLEEQGACAMPANTVPAIDGNKSLVSEIYNESLVKLKELMPDSMKSEGSAEANSLNFMDPTFRAQVMDLCKDLSEELVNLGKMVVDQVDQSTQTAEQIECGKCVTLAKDLCQNACHLLRETIIKIREDFAKSGVKVEVPNVKEQKEVSCELDKSKAKEDRGEEKEDKEESMDITEAGYTGQSEQTGKRDLPTLELDLTAQVSKSEEEAIEELLKSPLTPQTPADIREKIEFNADGFTMLESAPNTHKYINTPHQPIEPKSFMNSYRKELKLLTTSLPYGIYVKGFEERMDLFSVMIHGPKKTPYEDGVFFFEMKLPNDYPNSPPNVHYIAYCSDRLNPNLYEDGKVCVSLLGTWQGKGTEVWTKNSSFLQVLISIQGLILVSEPYYNEAGYEKQKGSQQGHENSRMYNEMALLKMVQCVSKTAVSPPEVFEVEVQDHMKSKAFGMISRLEYWLDATPQVCGTSLPIIKPHNSADSSPVAEAVIASTNPQQGIASPTFSLVNSASKDTSDKPEENPVDSVVENAANDKPGEFKCVDGSSLFQETSHQQMLMPEYPLLPVSKGFALTLRKNLNQLKKVLKTIGVVEGGTSSS